MIEGGIQTNRFMIVEVFQIILAQRLRCTVICTNPQIILVLNTVFLFEYMD